MRYLLTDLTPGKTYYLQFRSIGPGGEVSTWSRTFNLTTSIDNVAPKTPTGLAVVSVETAFRASWNAVTLSADDTAATDLDHYLVKVESDSSPGVSRVYVTPDTKFELTLAMNQDIFTTARGSIKFSVAAVDKTGNASAYSSTVSASNPAPTAPTNLVISELVDSIGLSWDANTVDTDLAGYQVWLSTTGSGGTYSKIWAGSATSMVHSTVNYATDHWYRVYSVDIFGTLSTALQSGAAARPGSTFTIDTTPPAVPTGLAATLTTAADLVTYASVSWNAVADPDGDLAGYRIGYRPNGATDWEYADADAEQTTARIYNLTPYVEYQFRIRSYDFMANFSAWSSTVTTSTAATNTAPAAPTGVAFSGGMQTATITWNENSESDLKDYEVQLDTVNTFNSGNLKTITTDGTVISFLNLTSGTTYYSRVRARDNLGLDSSWSSTVSGGVGAIADEVTDGNPPSSSPTPTLTGGVGFIYIKWTAVSNNDTVAYEVHMSTSSGFTPSGATLLGEVYGTAFVAKNTAAGAALAYGTTYYVKLVAKDGDGSASAGTQGSGQMTKANTADIAVNAITAASGIIADAAIGTAKIIDANITTAKIADLNVTDAKIANLAVTTAKINDLAVTNAKIGALAVDTAKIADLAVTNAKINTVDVNKLTAGTGIINDLTVKSNLTLGDASTDGVIKSYNWVSNTSGYRLNKTGLEINDGSIKAGALLIQDGHNLMPPQYADFEYTDYYYINSFWNSRGQGGIAMSGGLAQAATAGPTYKPYKGAQYLQVSSLGATAASYFYLGTTETDYNVEVEPGSKYIFSVYARNQDPTSDPDWVVRFKRNDNGAFLTETLALNHAGTNMTNWVRYQVVFTVPTGVTKLAVNFNNANTVHAKAINVDCVQIEKVEAGLETASQWKPPASTVIGPAGITTGYLRSNQNVSVAGTDLPSWSLNKDGNIQVGDALVRGKLIVGSTAESIQNLAPGSGDFESNVTGYSVYQTGATGTSIVRTTTAGEVISGTGSAKVAAAAGSKTTLGMSFSLSESVTAGNYLTLTGSVKTDYTGGTIEATVRDGSNNTLGTYVISASPVANEIYNFNGIVILDAASATATSVAIYQTGTGITTTSIIFDNIVVDSSSKISSSYVSSPDYQPGSDGWRIWGNGNVEFNNGVFRGTLGANMVTADSLVSELIISSTFKTAATGRRVEFSGSGLTLYASDNSLLVDMPTDEDIPATFFGDLLASSLYVTDDMTIGGTHNEISRAAELTIQSGTVAPTASPAVTIGWDQIDYGYDPAWNPYKYGLAYDSVGDWWMYIQNIYGANCNINYHDPDTGAYQWGITHKMRDVRLGVSLTTIGNEIFVLGQDTSGTWKVEVRNMTTRAWVRTMDVGSSFNYTPAIGNDGTNLVLAYPLNADKRVRFRFANKNDMTGSTVTSNYYMTSGTPAITSTGYSASGIFSGARLWFTQEGKTEVFVQSGTTGNTYAAASSENFVSPNTIRGMAYADRGSGGFFYTFSTNGKITKHTAVNWVGDDTEYSTWHAGITWYDSNATGSTHETEVGPLRTFTMKKRAGLTITTPPLPLRPTPTTTDDVVASGLYMARNASTPTNAQLQRQYYLPDGNTVTYLHINGGASANLPTPDTNATNQPPTSNGFSSINSAPGMIRSAGDEFYVTGTGAGEWGPIQISSAGALTINSAFVSSSMRPSDTGITGSGETTTSTSAVVYASGPKVDFVAPASGQVKIASDAAIRNSNDGTKTTVNLRVRQGTSTGSGTIMYDTETAGSRNLQYVRSGSVSVVTGLSPGTTYNAHLTFFTSDGANTAYISGARIVLEPTM